jgi:predicted branched-subunit amino acid permease
MFFLKENYTHPSFKLGMKDISSAAPGLAAWAVMIGVSMIQSGMSVMDSILMTLLVYAGSSQLAAIPLIAVGAPLWIIWATAFCVNLRFVVFSAHLRSYMMCWPKWRRMGTAYLIADLTYVQFIKRFAHPASDSEGQLSEQAYLAGNCFVSWASWMTASFVGIALAHVIPFEWGLGFAGILALVGVCCSLLSTQLKFLSCVVGGGVATALYLMPLKLNILVAIVCSVCVCLLSDQILKSSTQRLHEDGPA